MATYVSLLPPSTERWLVQAIRSGFLMLAFPEHRERVRYDKKKQSYTKTGWHRE